nr:MAG TPA: hypothetical protein [Caudoviricetes sp.]
MSANAKNFSRKGSRCLIIEVFMICIIHCVKGVAKVCF